MEPIALQLYTVRSLNQGDFTAVLRLVAEAGYTAVELAGFGGLTAAELKRDLDAFGLTAAGAHVGYALWEAAFDQAVADMATLGIVNATVPWLEPSMRPVTAAGVSRLAETLNEWGRKTSAAGIRLGYHNHEFEFDPIDGVPWLDRLLAETDPALVDLELDVAWARYAGADPAELIARYAGRVPLLHVKDLVMGGERTEAVFGEGSVDWDAVLPAAQAAGTRWYVVEQDNPADPARDIVTNLTNLRAKLAEHAIA